MAIAIDSVGSIQTNSVGVALTFAHTVSGANRYLHVAVYSAGSSPSTVASATYNGVAMTVVETELEDAFAVTRSTILGLIAPDEGTHNVVISLTAMSNAVIKACAISLTGVDQSTPRGTAVKAKSTGSAPTVNASSASGELVFDSMVFSSATPTVGASQTERFKDSNFAGSSEPGAATTTMSWTPSQTAWATVAVPIKPAAEGGDPPTLASIAPDTQHRNATHDVIVEGVTVTGTDFDAGNGTVNSSHADVTAENIVVVNATTITADIRIAAGSAAITANLSVETNAGESDPLPFSVLGPDGGTTLVRPTHRGRRTVN